MGPMWAVQAKDYGQGRRCRAGQRPIDGGAEKTVRRSCLKTLTRTLPTGIFYANVIKANFIFFDNREATESG